MSSPTPLPHEGAVSSHRGSFLTPAALIAGRTDRNTHRNWAQSLREEVVSFVVDHDEGGEVAHLDAPHGFHAQFGEINDLDLGDAVLCESGSRPADRAEVDVQVTVGLRYIKERYGSPCAAWEFWKVQGAWQDFADPNQWWGGWY